MFLVHFEENTVYAVFQDLSKESGKDISVNISKKLKDENVPKSLHKRIKNFFQGNIVLESNLSRQKAYISKLETYIDVVTHINKKNVYRLNLYVLPKDINISYDKDENKKITIEKIDKLSFHIFTLYNSLQKHSNEKLKLLKIFKGNTFLDLELEFYLQELNRLYDYLLTYRRSIQDKIICSDKEVGILIEDLNNLENDPLKRYQFVKVAHQKDLITFVYSLVSFLELERINYFKDKPTYKKLKNIISKINNYLLKISTSRHIKKDNISFETLQLFFNRYKNSKEILKNQLIYNTLELIFKNQLEEGVFISKSIDMTKMFEQVVEGMLEKKYEDRLYIGEEPKQITGIGNKVEQLNDINHLLEKESDSNNAKVNKKIKQFPDFLIEDQDKKKFHIIDAKYKIKDYLFKDRSMFWQVIVYSKLFNKDTEQKKIKKIIIFAENNDIDLNEFDTKKLHINNESSIDIDNCQFYYNEQVFDTRIGFIGVRILNQDL